MIINFISKSLEFFQLFIYEKIAEIVFVEMKCEAKSQRHSNTSGDSKGGGLGGQYPPDFWLTPFLAPPFFFLISRSSSFSWHAQ